MRISDWSSDVCSSDLRAARSMGVSSMDTPPGQFDQAVAVVQNVYCIVAGQVAAFQGYPAVFLVTEQTAQALGHASHVLQRFRCRVPAEYGEIGRASCRARWCNYV